MYKNLRQAPQQEPLYISAIIDARVASLLAESQIEEGSEIVITGEEEASQSHGRVIEVEVSETKVRVTIPAIKAEKIIVRSCDICWNCGECMIDD